MCRADATVWRANFQTFRNDRHRQLRLIASYHEGKPLQFSNFHRFAAIAACNPPDIKCINAFREKAKLYFGRNTENWADYFSGCVNHSIDVEFGRRSSQFAILRSRNFCQHSNLKRACIHEQNENNLFCDR